MPVPAISVIVVNWNRRDLLRACLLSLRAQTLRDLEVIVVDNGSQDGSPAMVLEEFPEAVLIRNAENRGFCAANNQGIRQARGRSIALLNNDAEAEPRWLEELISGLGAGADVGMCAGGTGERPKTPVRARAGPDAWQRLLTLVRLPPTPWPVTSWAACPCIGEGRSPPPAEFGRRCRNARVRESNPHAKPMRRGMQNCRSRPLPTIAEVHRGDDHHIKEG